MIADFCGNINWFFLWLPPRLHVAPIFYLPSESPCPKHIFASSFLSCHPQRGCIQAQSLSPNMILFTLLTQKSGTEKKRIRFYGFWSGTEKELWVAHVTLCKNIRWRLLTWVGIHLFHFHLQLSLRPSNASRINQERRQTGNKVYNYKKLASVVSSHLHPEPFVWVQSFRRSLRKWENWDNKRQI